MNTRLSMLISYLYALGDEFSKEEKKALKKMLNDWKETYGEFDPKISQAKFSDVVYFYNSLIREPAPIKSDHEAAILVDVVTKLLAEKCKED